MKPNFSIEAELSNQLFFKSASGIKESRKIQTLQMLSEAANLCEELKLDKTSEILTNMITKLASG